MTDDDYEKIVTVRDLINMLLDCEQSEQVIIKDEKGKLVKNVSICTRKNPRVMEVLFG